ncbi:hypothetical protein NDU88_005076 [Pleurodeles waltl]|uniref:Reverse transcriptase domain-containing protein n=1 Tax=Pleurodeles waltl TaxID=8319 RepID=A0AAV7UH10_PLEWA|nr:hypothetical protein NDU88_005076 [Pleurodeles waltl]
MHRNLKVQALIGEIRTEKFLRYEGLEKEITAIKLTVLQVGQPSPEQCHRLRLRQQQLRDLVGNKARAYVLVIQGHLYNVGDKANKLVAWLTGRDRGKDWVGTIRDKTGETHTTSEDIAKTFAQYYERLDESRATFLDKDCTDLLRDVTLQVLSSEDQGELEEDLSEEEIGQAIQELQSGKAAGLNGILVELYKCMAKDAAKYMLKMLQAARTERILPMDMRMTTIAVIPKKGKNPETCSSYWPISLLNAEVKVLAQVVANRLRNVITTVIHLDQAGFMP